MPTADAVRQALQDAVTAHQEGHHDTLRAAGLEPGGEQVGSGQPGLDEDDSATVED